MVFVTTGGTENIFTADKSSFMVFNPGSLKSRFSVEQIAILTAEIFFLNECNVLSRQSSLASLSIWLMPLRSLEALDTKIRVCICVYH